jgi:hypothetical protein
MYIDAHQHFWTYNPEEYGWIDERMSVLKRDFLPAELEALCSKNRCSGNGCRPGHTIELTGRDMAKWHLDHFSGIQFDP